MKKIVIIAANGFLGRCLSEWFVAKGWQVIGVARREAGMSEQAEFHQWDGINLGAWAETLNGAEVVVNLAGRSVNCRYNKMNRDLILNSRVRTTELIGEAIRGCVCPPKIWLNSSTATIYRYAEDKDQGEDDGEIGKGFSVEVAKAWEEAFFQSQVPSGIKKVALRTSMVLANEPGTVFDYLYKICQLGLGGKMGSGDQRVSWIHIEDFCRAVLFLIEDQQAKGCVNLVAPGVVTNREWMAEFRKIANRRIGLPAARWMLKIGTWIMRTETELVLKSRWVKADTLQKMGFKFRFSKIDDCLQDLIRR